MNVRFFNFSKRENSTARPAASAGLNFNVALKSDSGVLHPTIELRLSSGNPSQYNYAYIEEYGRYYYVSEWRWDAGVWTATLTVDVLATYKTQIGDADLYVLRAAAEKDGSIIDTFYPVKVGCQYDTSNINRPWTIAGTGCYILGVVSKDPSFGSINYYAMTATDLATLTSALLDTNSFAQLGTGFNITDCSLELQKSLVDPMQYIKSCVYVPITYASIPGLTQASLDVFGWTINAGCKKISDGLPYTDPTTSITVALKKHPLTSARGNYLNSAPYTKIQLSFPPFGVIDIDTSVTANAENIIIGWFLDLPTGKGILQINCNGNILNRIESQIGVPVQLSQVSRDYLGAATGLISGISNAVGAYMTGNITGGISATAGAIGNGINALIPRSQTIGAGGSYVQLFQDCKLDYQFFIPVDDDNSHNGRPLCAIRKPSALGGYMMIQDGDVAIAGTGTEAGDVRRYLESGFYYE